MVYKYGYVEGGQAASAGSADPLDAFVAAQASQADPLDAFVASQGGISKTAAPAAPAHAAPQRSALSDLGRQIGLTARAGATGLAGLPNMLGDVLNTGVNAVTGGINQLAGTNIPKFQMPSEVTQQALSAVGFPQPENATERVVQDVASAMAGAGGQARLAQALSPKLASPVAQQTAQLLSTAPGMQILGSAGSAGAASATREAGGGTGAQLAAGLAGAVIPTVGASLASRALANRAVPTSPPVSTRIEPTLGQSEPAFNIDISGTSQAPFLVAAGPSVSAGTAPARPFAAKTSQQQLAQGLAENEPFKVPELPAPKTSLPVAEQQSNIDTMRKIGLNSQRPSAITGDKFTAGQEFQQAKLDTPQGEVIRNQLQNEQNTIKTYATDLVKNTGATAGSPEAVGQSIRNPLRELSQHYDEGISALYKTADERAGGLPSVVPDEFGKLIGTNSAFAGKQENSALRRGIRAYMREQNIVDASGKMQPVTVQQAEGLRQYLNSQWSPQNSGLIGRIKESLDTDVTKTGGGDLYKLGRALHAERKNTLDNPKGIASLLQEEGPGGINQSVADERIGNRLMTMPTNQFKHVVDTIRNMPEGLQPQAQQALNEIKGVFAENIRLAGDRGGTQAGPSMWNAADVTRELNKQNSKLGLIFSPEEMESFQTLNRAGHILQTPSAYPGAAVQGHNLAQRGMIFAPTAAATAIGSHFGPLGAAGGAALGAALSKKAATAVDRKMAERLAQELLNPKTLSPK